MIRPGAAVPRSTASGAVHADVGAGEYEVVPAKGMNQDDGGAEMVYYDTASGGAVFSVGSMTYPACLGVDAEVWRITRNAPDRMVGVRESQ